MRTSVTGFSTGLRYVATRRGADARKRIAEHAARKMRTEVETTIGSWEQERIPNEIV